ncbi:MAG TPA: hypothetical protein VKA46_34715 [Gemmataceae bacterium]|nr:hypothetical protein [Gemmataceae bacterium]
MPEQLHPIPAEAAPSGNSNGGVLPGRDIREIVERSPEEAGAAVATNEMAWQAALRAKATGDSEVARRLRNAGVIGTGPMDGSQRDPMFARDDVLMCSPEEMAIIAEFNWAYEQQARGAFDAYRGQCVAIVNKTVLAGGIDLARITAEAAAKASVEPHRVAIFDVDPGEF